LRETKKHWSIREIYGGIILKKSIVLSLLLLFWVVENNGQTNVRLDGMSVDLGQIQPNEIILSTDKASEPGESDDDDDADMQKFHEKLKAALRMSRKTGVIFKDNRGKIYTNGEYKFKLEPEVKNEFYSHIEYRLDNNEFLNYSSPVSMEEERIYKFAYRGVDLLGNMEPLRSFNIIVDRTAPEVDVDFSSQEFKSETGVSYYKPGVKINARAVEKGSGLNAIILNVNNKGNLPLEEAQTEFKEGGIYNLYVRGLDNVYNLSKKKKITFGVDTRKPTVKLTGTPAVQIINNKSFCKLDSKLVIEATDAESGIASVEYSLDNESWFEYSAPIVVPKIDQFKVFYKSTDNAGNVSELKELNCLVDYTPPRTIYKMTTQP
jgi:hypothetical protein